MYLGTKCFLLYTMSEKKMEVTRALDGVGRSLEDVV